MNINLIIGTIGAVMILFAFIMINTKRWSDENIRFDLLNFIGSLLLFIYAILGKSYPFMVLNAVWALVSLKDVVTFFLNKRD